MILLIVLLLLLIESNCSLPFLSLSQEISDKGQKKILRISGRMSPKQKPVVIWRIDKEERNRAAASFLFRLAVLAGTKSCSPESGYRATQRESWDGYTRVLHGLARRRVWWPTVELNYCTYARTSRQLVFSLAYWSAFDFAASLRQAFPSFHRSTNHVLCARRKIKLIESKQCQMSLSKKIDLKSDFAAGVLSIWGPFPSYDPLIPPPPLHTVHLNREGGGTDGR